MEGSSVVKTRFLVALGIGLLAVAAAAAGSGVA